MTLDTNRLFKGHLPVMTLDDEAEVGKALARELRGQASVEAFTDPKQALDALREREFSVIICDLQMPNLNGLEFFAQAAELRPDTQRILLTAFTDLLSAEESINKARIHRIMRKPWEAHEIQEAVASAQKLFELQRENIELRRLALTDALTGIANHRYFLERLDSEFSRAKRFSRPLTLIMADVDDFKKYNDTFGHQRGDEVLRDVAQTLETTRRSMDTVARYGGEEFVIILPEATRAQGLDIAKRYLDHVLGKTGISLSLGVASFPDDAQTGSNLLAMADRSLLKAKGSGKGRVVAATEV